MNGAVEALAGKGFLVDGPVRVAVEEAPVLRLHLFDPARGHGHQRPGQVLIIDELPAFQGVDKMFLEGIGRVQDHVVPSLDHARTSAFADDRFGHQQDL